MICPHCGSDTPAPGGMCSSCRRVVADVATAVLTPPPPPARPEADDATRLGGVADFDLDSAATAPPPPPRPRSSAPPPSAPAADSDATRLTTGTGSRRPGATGPLNPGQAFGPRYHIIRLLGAGGMGAVYQAWDEELGVAVALKVVLLGVTDDPLMEQELERRFKRELLLARQVTHKNVVRIHDLGEIDGIKYITMPYVQGSDLATILTRDGKLPVARVLKIAKQVAAGLSAAHEAGVVHRDLKPANIMLDPEGQALIMDFGIARSVNAAGGTVAGAVVGTLEYMAPEQAKGQLVDQRADIYAFGLILYDLLAGRRDIGGSNSAVAELMARMQQSPPLLRTLDESIPEPVEQVVARCIEPNAAVRYQTIAELNADFDRLDANGRLLPTAAPSTTVRTTIGPVDTDRKARPAVSRRTLALAAAAMLVLAIGGFALRDRIFPGSSSSAQPAGGTGPAMSLAILPFRNASGDASLDWLSGGLAEMLRTEIGQSASLRTISSDRSHQLLSDLRIEPDATLNSATLRKLAEFGNADTVVWGQFLKIADEIRIDATLQDVKGDRSVPLKVQAVTEAALPSTVTQLAQAIRDNLSLSAAAVAELKATAFKPSTASLDALRAYNEGLTLARQAKHSDALKRFEAASVADPAFALAFSKMSQTYAALGYDAEAELSSRRAVDLSERLPPQERYVIQATHARVTNDFAKAIASYEQLAKVAPDDPDVNFELAGLYEERGTFDRARDGYARIVERDPKNAGALLALGRVEIKRGNPQESLQPLNNALALAVNFSNEAQQADIYHAIGVAYRRLDKPQEALRFYQDSLNIKRRLDQKRGIASSLVEIAHVQTQVGKGDAALAAYNEALAIQRDIGDKQGTGLTLFYLGGFYDDGGQYDRALTFYKESLQIQRELGNASMEATCLNTIGNIYLAQTRFDDALTYYERALQIREKTQVPADIADTLHNLGETSAHMGRYDAALEQYLRALELRRKVEDPRGAAMESNSMGTLFEYQGRFGAAVKAKEEALKGFRGLNDRGFWLGELLSQYGSGLAQIGRNDEAAKVLDEALTLARSLDNRVLISQTLNFQGDLKYYGGDARGARSLYDQAAKEAARTTDQRLVLLARANLAKVDISEGRTQAAAGTLKGLAAQADSRGLRYLSVQCTLLAGEALLAAKNYTAARTELERARVNSERLGLRALQARTHHLLATTFRMTNNAADASRHASQARRILEEIRKEARTDAVTKRADLAPILAEVSP